MSTILCFWFFYKRIILWFYLFCNLDSNTKSSSLWLEKESNDLHNESLTLSLLEICCSLSSLNVLQVLRMFFKFFDHGIFFTLVGKRIQWSHNDSLTLNLLEICCSSNSLNILWVLWMFFEFEGFWVESLWGF